MVVGGAAKKERKKRAGEGQGLGNAVAGNNGNKKSSQVKARKKAKKDVGG